MDEINMAANEFSERIFSVPLSIAREQLQVGFTHCQKYIATGRWNPTENLFKAVTRTRIGAYPFARSENGSR